MQESPACLLRARKVLGGRGMAIVTITCLLGSLALSGCNNYPAGLTPVSGKLTLDNKPWPKEGRVYFTPIKPLQGHPSLPAAARINPDGSFTVGNPASPGLVPGEYGAAIICATGESDEHHAGKSAVAARYASAETSGLKFTVDEGAKPIVLNWDIKSK
jgi:hypothetical protein